MGLTCDHLVSAEVVTADGRLLRCSEREHSDLFWALRGGGGGNFGVCTSYTFTTNPVSDVTLYDITWEWADAAAVFEAFQRVIQRAPDEFSARLGVGTAGNPKTGGKEPPTISALGQYFGPKHELVDLLAPALRAGRVSKKLIARRTFWQAKDYFFHTTPAIAYEVKSAYLKRPLAGAGVDVLLRAVERWPGSHNKDGAGAAMFASGGAINRVPADATRVRTSERLRGPRHRNRVDAARLGAHGGARSGLDRGPGGRAPAAHDRRRLSELHRPRAAGLAERLLRREPQAPHRDQAALRPRQRVSFPAEHPAR